MPTFENPDSGDKGEKTKKPGEEKQNYEEDIKTRAYFNYEKRMRGEIPGENEMLRRNGIEPGTEEARIFLEKFDWYEAEKQYKEEQAAREAAPERAPEINPPAPEVTASPEAKAEAEKAVDALPEGEKENASRGIANFGFWVEKKKAGFLARKLRGTADNLYGKDKGGLGKFVEAFARTYEQDEENAQAKLDFIGKSDGGKSKKIAQVMGHGVLIGNLAKITTLTVNALRLSTNIVMGLAMPAIMLAARGASAFKEVRLGDEELKLNEEDAWEETHRIMEEAKARQGGAEVTGADLKNAYMDQLPQDLRRRLEESPEAGAASRIMKGAFKPWINYSLNRMDKQLAEIDTKFGFIENQKEKKQAQERVYKYYEKRLKDYDRMLSNQGTLDTMGGLLKTAEIAGKVGIAAFSAVTMTRLIDNAFEHLTKFFSGDKAEMIANLEAALRVNPSNGLDENEIMAISEEIKRRIEAGESGIAKSIYEHYQNMQITGSNKKVGELWKQSGFAGIFAGAGQAGAEAAPLPPQPGAGGKGGVQPGIPERAPDAGNMPEPEIAPSGKAPGSSGISFEDVIDSSKSKGDDSIWESTKEIFMSHGSELGYKGQGGADLDKWAETQTANLVNQLSQEQGGRLRDLVHDGDKVIVEMEGEKPHLRFEQSSNIEPGFLEHVEKAARPGTVGEEIPLSDEVLPTAGARPLPQESSFAEVFERAPDSEKPRLIEQKLMEVLNVSEGDLDLRGKEKMHAFSELLMQENAKIWGMAESDLKKRLEQLSTFIADNTRILETQNLEQKGASNVLFPVENKNGQVFFVRSEGDNRFRILKLVHGERQYIGNQSPSRLNFSFKELKKFLGYK